MGAYEDPYDGPWPVTIGVEADLDFEAAWPLIWPQKTALFQEDDQYYEYTGDFYGFWNSESLKSSRFQGVSPQEPLLNLYSGNSIPRRHRRQLLYLQRVRRDR